MQVYTVTVKTRNIYSQSCYCIVHCKDRPSKRWSDRNPWWRKKPKNDISLLLLMDLSSTVHLYIWN